jgi:aerobic-type carbon monoxide dehydrogenase small subunit (CoxS/CutS family)
MSSLQEANFKTASKGSSVESLGESNSILSRAQELNLEITLDVSGDEYTIVAKPGDSLNKVLRIYLGLTGTKQACDYGGCGSCTVLLEGDPVYSCMVPAIRCQGKKIITIEYYEKDEGIRAIQDAFAQSGAIQCGFCTPGMVLSLKALLDRVPDPSIAETKQAIAGNICRCTGYVKILKAVQRASQELSRKRDKGE